MEIVWVVVVLPGGVALGKAGRHELKHRSIQYFFVYLCCSSLQVDLYFVTF